MHGPLYVKYNFISEQITTLQNKSWEIFFFKNQMKKVKGQY